MQYIYNSKQTVLKPVSSDPPSPPNLSSWGYVCVQIQKHKIKKIDKTPVIILIIHFISPVNIQTVQVAQEEVLKPAEKYSWFWHVLQYALVTGCVLQHSE